MKQQKSDIQLILLFVMLTSYSSVSKKNRLAVEAGLPGFINVLDPVLSEMQVEEIILAEEIKEKIYGIIDRYEKSLESVGKK